MLYTQVAPFTTSMHRRNMEILTIIIKAPELYFRRKYGKYEENVGSMKKVQEAQRKDEKYELSKNEVREVLNFCSTVHPLVEAKIS